MTNAQAGAIWQQGAAQPKQRPLPEAQIMTLQEARTRFDGPLPAVGSYVTMASNAPTLKVLKGAPGLVVEVTDDGLDANNERAARRNTRVLWVDDDGDVVSIWVEHWHLVPYVEGFAVTGAAN